jgi:hypothetical protein
MQIVLISSLTARFVTRQYTNGLRTISSTALMTKKFPSNDARITTAKITRVNTRSSSGSVYGSSTFEPTWQLSLKQPDTFELFMLALGSLFVVGYKDRSFAVWSCCVFHFQAMNWRLNVMCSFKRRWIDFHLTIATNPRRLYRIIYRSPTPLA